MGSAHDTLAGGVDHQSLMAAEVWAGAAAVQYQRAGAVPVNGCIRNNRVPVYLPLCNDKLGLMQLQRSHYSAVAPGVSHGFRNRLAMNVEMASPCNSNVPTLIILEFTAEDAWCAYQTPACVSRRENWCPLSLSSTCHCRMCSARCNPRALLVLPTGLCVQTGTT